MRQVFAANPVHPVNPVRRSLTGGACFDRINKIDRISSGLFEQIDFRILIRRRNPCNP